MNKLNKILIGMFIISGMIAFIYIVTNKPPIPNETIIVFTFQGHDYLRFRDCIIHSGSCTNELHKFPFNYHE